jgi:hypothetical protein
MEKVRFPGANHNSNSGYLEKSPELALVMAQDRALPIKHPPLKNRASAVGFTRAFKRRTCPNNFSHADGQKYRSIYKKSRTDLEEHPARLTVDELTLGSTALKLAIIQSQQRTRRKHGFKGTVESSWIRLVAHAQFGW